MKLSKTQLFNRMQSGRFPGRLLVPLMKVGLPWKKNVHTHTLAKIVLIPLELTAATAAADTGIH